ncbi:hypothetical protein [Paenibacillus caui]|nr:hypothetical protein [Paenibacillus caui]
MIENRPPYAGTSRTPDDLPAFNRESLKHARIEVVPAQNHLF